MRLYKYKTIGKRRAEEPIFLVAKELQFKS